MQIGISSSCFYPCNTLESLDKAGRLHAPVTEIFLNTFHELEPDFIKALADKAREHNTKVLSVHPFSSSFESFLFFSEYEGRFEDGLELYRRYFEACGQLGAKIVVFHGNIRVKSISMQEYAKRFRRLVTEGEKYGVIVAQENVDRCQSGDVASIRALRQYAECPLHFVLDLKQCRRFGGDIYEMAQAMGPKNICHLHLSDETDSCICAMPGQGRFDFAGFFDWLQKNGCRADSVIELYRGDYEKEEDLTQAMKYLRVNLPIE